MKRLKTTLVGLIAPENRWFNMLAILLAGLRLLHFGELIDGPHTWRQCDTAHFIRDFYKNGIDLLHPSVCWMGGYGTIILEFPLHEAIAAVLYWLFGESHIWARWVTMVFFLISAIYLFKIIQHLSDRFTAQMGTLIYLAMPLSLYYSRAIHIDFMAVGLGHMALWYFLLGIERRSGKLLLIGSLIAVPAFLTKAPYLFYFVFPLIWWTTRHKSWGFILKWSPVLGLPIVVFLGWIGHTKTINSLAPDWYFIPGYHKFTAMSGWYFGSLEQRLDPENWHLLSSRLLNEVTGWLAAASILWALMHYKKIKNLPFVFWWSCGTVIYLGLFFNLNWVHNYYQIPFLAPMAFLAACGISLIRCRLADKSRWVALLWVVLPAGILAENIAYAETHYYQPTPEQIAIGKQIQAHTSEDALVITSWGGIGCHYPNLLYRSRRNGWNIAKSYLTPELCYALYKEGATCIAEVRYSEEKDRMYDFTHLFPDKKVLPLNDKGLQLFLHRADSTHPQIDTIQFLQQVK